MAQLSRLSDTLPGLKIPIKIVHLSDLHYGLYTRASTISNWVGQTLSESPDLILITGDFVDRLAWRKMDGLVQALEPLEAPLGVWGVWGNHDHSWNKIQRLGPALQEAGVHILVNDGRLIREDLFLAGLDESVQPTPDMKCVLAAKPKDATCIVMSHSPDLLPHLPAELDLVLSGHTHGGQIKLPGLGALRTSSIYGQRFLEGWIKEDGLPLAYVSRGLGTTLLPVRWGSPSEIVVLELTPG